jgi:hypothetical protein
MTNPLETYLKELTEIRASGAGVKETSYYGPLSNLLNEIGKTLKPRSSASSTSRTRARYRNVDPAARPGKRLESEIPRR